VKKPKAAPKKKAAASKKWALTLSSPCATCGRETWKQTVFFNTTSACCLLLRTLLARTGAVALEWAVDDCY
jgi:hypothetical protein